MNSDRRRAGGFESTTTTTADTTTTTTTTIPTIPTITTATTAAATTATTSRSTTTATTECYCYLFLKCSLRSVGQELLKLIVLPLEHPLL